MIYTSWDFFSDPHSAIAFYRVGLGTSKTMADVITPVNVGLMKSKYIFNIIVNVPKKEEENPVGRFTSRSLIVNVL